MVKLFVGGFPLHISELELVQLVSLYGTVCTIKMIRDRKTGICKGYAFLEMKNMADATNAVEVLNGRSMEGQTLTLRINPEEEAAPAPKKPYQPKTPMVRAQPTWSKTSSGAGRESTAKTDDTAVLDTRAKYVKIEGAVNMVKKKRPRKV